MDVNFNPLGWNIERILEFYLSEQFTKLVLVYIKTQKIWSNWSYCLLNFRTQNPNSQVQSTHTRVQNVMSHEL